MIIRNKMGKFIIGVVLMFAWVVPATFAHAEIKEHSVREMTAADAISYMQVRQDLNMSKNRKESNCFLTFLCLYGIL